MLRVSLIIRDTEEGLFLSSPIFGALDYEESINDIKSCLDSSDFSSLRTSYDIYFDEIEKKEQASVIRKLKRELVDNIYLIKDIKEEKYKYLIKNIRLEEDMTYSNLTIKH